MSHFSFLSFPKHRLVYVSRNRFDLCCIHNRFTFFVTFISSRGLLAVFVVSEMLGSKILDKTKRKHKPMLLTMSIYKFSKKSTFLFKKNPWTYVTVWDLKKVGITYWSFCLCFFKPWTVFWLPKWFFFKSCVWFLSDWSTKKWANM